MNKVQILVIEDDIAVGNLITTTLEMENYQFRLAKTAKQGIMNVLSYNPDIMLLDLGLPDMDGLEVIKKVRSWSNIPIIVVSARSEDQDKVKALDLGADDYLTKPFSVDELLARLRVTIRRLNNSQTISVNESVYENGDLTINYAQGCVYENGHEIHLTPIEYKLLCVLAKNTDKVLTHNYIMQEVWEAFRVQRLQVFVCLWLHCVKRLSQTLQILNIFRRMWGLDIACCGKQKKQIKRANHYHNNGRVRF